MSAAAQVIDELYELPDGGQAYAASYAKGWRIPTPVTVDEWADSHRYLPRESSSESGPWRTKRTPYLREIMLVLSTNHPCKRVVVMAGTQVGKTESGNNWIGSIIHQVPGPVMVVQPTVSVGKRWTRQRFNPMIENSEVLSGLIKPARSRDSGNTTTMKEFPGGVLVIAGANSATDLRSMPVKYLFMDEVDAYPMDVDGEGDPVTLAERRTSTFARRKILLTSSPTVKGESVIEDEYEQSDQRHLYVPCPHCGHEQVLRDDGLTDEGTHVCEARGHEIEEHHKTWMLENGHWIAHNPDSDVPGFHLPSYYAPIGLGYTWKEIADMRREAKKKPEKWKAYVNTIMAETYEDESGKVDWKEVKDRAGGYSSRTIPAGCLMLTAGVDVQDDRFAIHIVGWGRNERQWTIDYFEIPADPGIKSEWKKLDEQVLDVTFQNSFGVDMNVLAMGLDTGGHHTHMAYNYARTRKARRVLAMKGSSFPNKPIIATRPSPKDIKTDGKIIPSGVDLWNIGTDTAKGAIFAKLHADAGMENQAEHCMMFPGDLPDDFFQQLTAERYDTTQGKWVKPRHKRNEVLDTTVYAYAAACHPAIRVHMLRDKDWDKIEAKVQPIIQDLFAAGVVDASQETNDNSKFSETIAETGAKLVKTMEALRQQGQHNNPPKQDDTPHQPKKPARKKRKRKGGFVGGWKS